MNETKQKGLLTELHCELSFVELGFLVMRPNCEDSRYDFVVDLGSKFIKIQCKTCAPSEDGTYIKFACRSTRSTAQETISRRYTKDEIDYFYTYYQNKSYLVPVNECSVTKTLRYAKPSNGQETQISYADDFELKKVLQKLEGVNEFKEISSGPSPNYITPKPGSSLK